MTAPGMVARRLARLEAACRETRSQLARIERQIQCRAERITVTAKRRVRRLRRCGPSWAPADERLLREHVDRLIFERRDEIAALAQNPPAAARDRRAGRSETTRSICNRRGFEVASSAKRSSAMDETTRAAFERLLHIARGDTGQSRRVASFILAW